METTQQAGLQTLPNELLLSILEDGAFGFLELVRLGTTAPFRSLLQKPYRSLAECLFLRTLDVPDPSTELFDNLTMRITAVVRKGMCLTISLACFDYISTSTYPQLVR
jgi:hypothetical protein